MKSVKTQYKSNRPNKFLTMFLIIALCLTLLPTLAFAKSSTSVTKVSGYTKKNGTYVKPYYRTTQNATTSDNFSHIGNYNPYTGEWGTKTDGDSVSNVSTTSTDINSVSNTDTIDTIDTSKIIITNGATMSSY